MDITFESLHCHLVTSLLVYGTCSVLIKHTHLCKTVLTNLSRAELLPCSYIKSQSWREHEVNDGSKSGQRKIKGLLGKQERKQVLRGKCGKRKQMPAILDHMVYVYVCEGDRLRWMHACVLLRVLWSVCVFVCRYIIVMDTTIFLLLTFYLQKCVYIYNF